MGKRRADTITMSDATLSVLAVTGFAVACFLSGYLAGRDCGSRKGRDAEWCRQYFERIEREKARRRANGQFKSNAEKSSNNQSNLL